jgi:hypothetical protein
MALEVSIGTYSALAAVVLAIMIGVPAVAQDQEKIESALSAAPPEVAESAKIMDMQGNILREGTGDYTCFPDEGAGPMCLDAEWLTWADAWMNRKEDYKPSEFGLAYMLAGDTGASNIDPFATEKTADNQWVVEGPHVMILVPDATLLESITDDSNAGGPYVMWKGTPYQHIMMPTGPRPEQPQ